MTCVLTGQKIEIIFEEFTSATNVFNWQLSGITNAPSTKPSVFNDIAVRDSEDFIVSSFTQEPSISNREPRLIQDFGITQTTTDHSKEATYTIEFTPLNPLPATGSVQIVYPSQVSMVNKDATVCKIVTDFGESPCSVQDSSRLITATGAFASNPGYLGKISIIVEQVLNPVTNRPGNGFVIQTYQDPAQTYIQDKLGDFILYPEFKCNYPCAECTSPDAKGPEAEKNFCTACWKGNDDPLYLMFYPDKKE